MRKFAIQFECPNCSAQPGEKCTQPTDFSRREVNWFHSTREARADKEATEIVEYLEIPVTEAQLHALREKAESKKMYLEDYVLHQALLADEDERTLNYKETMNR